MGEQKEVGRRRFIKAGLWGGAAVAAGGGLGWTAARFKGGAGDGGQGYDLRAFMTIDPALLVSRPAGEIAVEFRRPRRLLVTRDGRILVAGDSSVQMLDREGTVRETIALDRAPTCLAEGPGGGLYVGLGDGVRVLDAGGRSSGEWPGFGGKTYLTSIAFAGDEVFLADAGNREVIRCGLDGRALSRFGAKDDAAGNPGFVVPSPYFDLAAGGDGLLHVANPGRHRVETYSLDGRFQGSWGEASCAPDGFCGCCNPVYFKLLPGGRYLTSEKGLTRVKFHGPDGALQGVVAGPEQLAIEADMAARAAEDCRVGCGFDVACDSRGRVLVLDVKSRRIRVFEALV
jgi:hypothetical protein